MTPSEAAGANAEQVKFWNETGGPKWVENQGTLDAMLEPLGRLALDACAVAVGERVLDVGCGCGATSLELVRRVGRNGSVTGIDITSVMLQRARQNAKETGLTNVEFVEADAQVHRFAPKSFDVIFSRFGVMFFADPRAAFANLSTALRPGGRLAFVCWQPIEKNPWFTLPTMAALKHLTLPPPPPPGAPGPFAFADQERVRGILNDAGFSELRFESHKQQIAIGDGNLDRTVEFMLQLGGPMGEALRKSDPATRARVAVSVREALAPFHGPQGLRMDSAVWVVTGRRT